MKVVLDIDRLLVEGRITTEEHSRLKGFATEDTGSLALNILIGFGVVATASGALMLMASATASILLGVGLSSAGVFLGSSHRRRWGLLGFILVLVGSLTWTGGVVALTEGSVAGFVAVTVVFLASGILVKSSFLAAMGALSLSASVGAMMADGHASYFLIRQPTTTVVLCSVMSLGAYQLSKRLPLDMQPVAITFSRTSLFLVNLGFWVGSLWGDSLWNQRDDWTFGSGDVIPDWVFVIGWTVGLIATGVWAARNDRRWVVNLLAVFGAIHFYTQYFERLGASPESILFAGLLAVAIVISIGRYNRRQGPQG